MVISGSKGLRTCSSFSTIVVRQAAADEILGQFQADEAGPEEHRRRCTPPSRACWMRSVSSQISQREDAGQIDAGDRRHAWARPRGQDQLIVAFQVLPPGRQLADPNLLGLAVEGFHRAQGSHVELVARERSRSGVTMSSLPRSAISPPR